MNVAPQITIAGDRMLVNFDQFGIDAYPLFLKVKQLPESDIAYLPESEGYEVSAPARFAKLLGVDAGRADRDWLPLPELMFDDQLAITRMALDAKRFACWSDCGLGKTFLELEWMRQVGHRTGQRVLLFTLNEIINQTIDEAAKFYGDSFPLLRLRTREEMKDWAASRGKFADSFSNDPDSDPANPIPQFAITNYEKMNHDQDDQIVSELRHLGGVALDESDRLKGGGGKQKWALIKSCRGIEFKLSCTATPAPNDTMEFASQASFLEKMRTEADIIWTYFQRDETSHRWTVKRHARQAFFEFMSSWSIYVRDPRKYGWRKDHEDIPEPEIIQHLLPITADQQRAMQAYVTDPSGQTSFVRTNATNAIQRSKLSQIAKGFVYLKGQVGKFQRIESEKPAFVAKLIQQEMAAGLQVLVWTTFDAESQILVEELSKLGIDQRGNAGESAGKFAVLNGKTKEAQRLETLTDFKSGKIPCLISLASMLGYGMNFQCCGSMIFSGFNDSYVQWYQAIRRAVRYGQEKKVRVHVPFIESLEMDMLENVLAKESRNEADIQEMEQNYIAAMKRTKGI